MIESKSKCPFLASLNQSLFLLYRIRLSAQTLYNSARVNVIFLKPRKKMLNITERQKAETTILDLEGNIILGGGSKRLGTEVRRLIAEGKTDILLNFAGVKYLDSSGVGELISLSAALSQNNGSLKLSNLPGKVEEVLTLSSVLPMFETYKDESEAVASKN